MTASLDTLFQDIRHAARMWSKNLGFAALCVFVLALGIGANTTIFSLVSAALLRRLPYPDADRLVWVWNQYPKSRLPKAAVSIPDYLDRRAQADALEESALLRPGSYNLGASGGTPERVLGLAVTPSFFAVLGTQPRLGRGFTEAEAQLGAEGVVVLSDALWKSHYGADPAIVGRDVPVNGESRRVVGVMSPGFVSPLASTQLWVPFAFTPAQQTDNERGNEFSAMIARLRPGASITLANEQVSAIVRRNLDRLPQLKQFAETSGFGAYVISYRDELVGDLRPTLWLLQVGVGFLLLIACANVANLLLMRATTRRKDLAVRRARGAGRGRLAQQLLTESVLLALIGGSLGVLLAVWGVEGLAWLGADQIPRAFKPIRVDRTALAFTLLISVATGLLFGLAPLLAAWRQKNLPAALKDSGARSVSSGRGEGRARGMLVVAETGLALTILLAATLLARSVWNLRQVNPGFRAAGVLSAQLSLPKNRYADAAAMRAFFERALTEVRAVPGVGAAGLVSSVPFGDSQSGASYNINGYTLGPGENAPHANVQTVDPGYFSTLGIPLLRGRLFSDADGANAPKVVLIDRLLATRYFSDGDPLGREIFFDSPDANPTRWTIVGVVNTVRATELAKPVEKETIYFPLAQAPQANMALLARTTLAPQALTSAVREAVRRADAELPLFDVKTMDQRLVESLQSRQGPMWLLALFGLSALLLAAVGLYGVLASAVAQRTREIGIRMALGAQRGHVLRWVLGQGMVLTLIGVGAGLAASLGLMRFLRGWLYGISPGDPLTFGGIALLLGGVAFFACLLPARRATRVNPIVALREE